jgi:hypothetical protein
MTHASRLARLAGAVALITAAGLALAHGPGYGRGGWGPCGGDQAGYGPGCGAGLNGAAVSSLLTRDEWIEHRNKMHSLQTFDECKAYVGEFSKQLQERAKAKGTTASGPNEWMCERMRERGFFKG